MKEIIKNTIGECLNMRVAQTPEQVAVEYQDLSYTWAEIDRLSDYLAVRMTLMGIKRQDHVGIWSVNTPNWILTFLALEKIGAVPVLLNTCYKVHELKQVLKYADVKYVYYGDEYKSVLYQPIVEKLKQDEGCGVERWIPIGKDNRCHWFQENSFFACEKNARELNYLEGLKKQVRSKDTAAILFTSGTTSMPKGVMLSHENLVNSALGTLAFTQWKPDDKMLVAVPLFHCFGLTSCLLTSIHVGFSIRLLEYFKTIKVLEAVDRYRCSVLNGVPSMFLAMIRNPKFSEYRLDSLQSGIIAGSPVSEREYLDIQEHLPDMALLPSYGQTESSPCVTLMLKEDPYELRVTSAGRIIDWVKVRIVDPKTGEVLSKGQTGEIQVNGYNVMQGYYKLPEETKRTILPDGWLRTGDMGYLSDGNYLHIVGRLKEMIIRCGENISPREIEQYIEKLDFVQQVKVIGIPAEVVQEKIIACVIPKKGRSCSEAAVISYLTACLAHYKIPSHVLEFQEFPLNASGKIKLQDLKQQVMERLNKNTEQIRSV